MTKLEVESLSILNKQVYIAETIDEFMKLRIVFDRNKLSHKSIMILNNNLNLDINNGSDKNKEQINIYLDIILEFTCQQILNTVKFNSKEYVKLCKKKGGSLNITLESFENKIICYFEVAKEYQSESGNPEAWLKFKTKHNKLPNLSEWKEGFAKEEEVDKQILIGFKEQENIFEFNDD